MKIAVSNGELLDKISILEIKLSKIKDTEKLKNVKAEHAVLFPMCKKLLLSNDIYLLYNKLYNVNLELWEIEDAIRIKEKQKHFDDGFIELARHVYIKNDLRAEIKRNINLQTQSQLIEEKSYETYQ